MILWPLHCIKSWHICPRRFTNIRADSHLGFFKWLIVKLLFRYILSKDCALNNIQHISYLTKVYPIRVDTSLPRRSNYDSTPNFFWMISSKSGCILLCFKLLRVDSILLTSLSLILMTLSCFAFAVSCVVHLLLDMVQSGTLYWLSLFGYSVLPFLLFIIPLVPKLLYRLTRIISLSVSEWLYNIDSGIETLRSRWH